jgi:hypothetical protein
MNHRKLMLAAVLLLAAPTSAYADAIDGDWCSADGQHMTIKGDDITTPDGNQIKGNYTRHAFDYVVPAGEAGAGETIRILLRSGYLALSHQGPADARGSLVLHGISSLKEWRRCANRTS